MKIPANHIQVCHGKLTVNVPKNLFFGNDAEPVESKVIPFRELMMERYPWLSENSMDVFMKEARKVMLRTMEEETKGKSVAESMIEKGNVEGAIKHMLMWAEKEPGNPDIWYYLGQLYFKVGKNEEAHKAMNRGRSLI